MKNLYERHARECDRRDGLLTSIRRTMRDLDDYDRKFHMVCTMKEEKRLQELRDDKLALFMSDLDELRRCLRNIEDLECGR
jgi:predicted DNA-binding protein YlxM (UPF0122 family)